MELLEALTEARRALFAEWKKAVATTSRAYVRSEIDYYLAAKLVEEGIFEQLMLANSDYQDEKARLDALIDVL